MKALRVFFRGELINIPVSYEAGITIHNRNGYYYNINLSGMDDSDVSHVWIDAELNIDDEIEIEVVNINTSTPPKLTRKAFSDKPTVSEEEVDKIWSEKLDEFYMLKKLLTEEGLLYLESKP